jgi:ABC-type nitrate/sulfonate/bicarbonate transport system substrate-binding protein
MSWITHGLTVIAILVVAVCSAAAQDKIVIGTVGSGNTLKWPLYIAEKKGYFDQEKFALASAFNRARP